jgi:hypothetical protein
MARLGFAQRASQCGEVDFTLGTGAPGHIAAFQSVFNLVDVLRRELRAVRDLAEDLDLHPVAESADLNLAATSDWGGGRVSAAFPTVINAYVVRLTGFTPEGLGLPTFGQAPQSLVLVGSRPLHADCVAGTRPADSCPTDPPPTIYFADSYQDTTASSLPDGAGVGLEGRVLDLFFENVPAAFEGFLVQKPNPNFNGGRGRVLAYLSKVATTGTTQNAYLTTEVVSPKQRQLANMIFGHQPMDQAQRTCASIAPTSLPRDYCIEGMKRDMFVPLANEITSEGTGGEDSWLHYLRVAEEAAAKADELGRQLIEVGLQQDLRQEAAIEEVGQLCGAYPNTIQVSSENGEIQPTDDNDKINACISEETIDLVFLRTDPYAGFDDPEDAGDKIKEDFCDNPLNAGVNPPFCNEDSEDITHAALGFVTTIPESAPATTAEECAQLADAFDPASGTLKRPTFSGIVRSAWASRAGLLGALSGLRLKQFTDGNWIALQNHVARLGTYNGVRNALFPGVGMLSQEQQGQLDETAQDVWPACQSSPLGCVDDATILGSFFGTPAGSGTQGEILREVETAIFYLGALAGQIPQEVIELPLPAANTAGLGSGIVVSAPTLYGSGHFTNVAGGYTLQSTGFRGRRPWMSSEVKTVGKGLAVDTGLVSTRNLSGLPPWLTTLYDRVSASPGSYVLLPTLNAPIRFSEELPIVGAPGVTDATARDSLEIWLQQLAQAYKCVGQNSSGTCLASCIDGEVKRVVLATLESPPREVVVEGDAPSDRLFTGLIFGNQNLPRRFVCTESAPLTSVFETREPNELYASVRILVPVIPEEPDPFFVDYGFGKFDLPELLGDEGGKPFERDWGGAGVSFPPECAISPLPLSDVVTGNCGQHTWGPDSNSDDAPQAAVYSVAHDRLRPSQCPPSERLELYLNKKVENDCDAMGAVVRALALSCMSAQSVRLKFGPPPTIKSLGDFFLLEAWVDRAAQVVGASVDAMYLVNVPASVVGAALNDQVNVPAVGQGDRGRLLLEVGKNLNDLESSIANIESSFRQLNSEIRKARIDIEYSSLSADLEQMQVAFQRLEVDRQTAVAALARTREEVGGILNALGAGVSGASAGAALGPVGAAVGGLGAAGISLYDTYALGDDQHETNMSFLVTQGQNLSGQESVAESIEQNRIGASLATLSENSMLIYQAISDHLSQASNGQATALQNLGALMQTQSAARMAMAHASSEDFVTLDDGELLPLHVNTVLRRQSGVLEHRYKRALQGAKRAGYLARLAIEQRLGTRMNDLVESIGPIDAPSLWVDDLCSVQGIDYNALREATPPPDGEGGASGEEGEELDLIKGFADQYIGDYVARLKEFVEFYNIQFPFREADDTAILSLREDLRNSDTRCLRESKNLLFHSDRLDGVATNFASDGVALGGWRVSACEPEACLMVTSGAGLINGANPGVPLEPPGGGGGITWLQTLSIQDLTPDVGGDGPVMEDGPRPAATVYQTVQLRAGQRYALSWWDQARDPDGTGYDGVGDPPPYRVTVGTSDWLLLATETFVPLESETGLSWSERRDISFIAPTDGNYQVAFSASDLGEPGASLAIANVQLEATTGDAIAATSYEATGAKRLVFSGDCPIDDPVAFRKRFDYRCGSDGCFHELRDLVIVDTEVLNQGFSSLVGKVAVGNYNYRHTGTALNMVGTGVLDCSADPRNSCFSSGYLEYDLSHYGFNVPLIDYVGDVRCFNFGAGTIRSGKALATERLLSLPLGSADRDLISQAAFLKPEFAGRPLSGAYRLRVKDQPALVWENLEDIQLLVNYRYWSRVDRGLGN